MFSAGILVGRRSKRAGPTLHRRKSDSRNRRREALHLEGTVHDGAILLDGPAKLPEGARVAIEVTSVTETPSPESETTPTLLSLLKLAGIAKDLPDDFAAQHDHYIHGTAKR